MSLVITGYWPISEGNGVSRVLFGGVLGVRGDGSLAHHVPSVPRLPLDPLLGAACLAATLYLWCIADTLLWL